MEIYDLAIISMAGRFPGADSIERFWENIRDGVESIRQFRDDELLRRGVPLSALNKANFVKVGAILEDTDQFAAPFFGFSPREAELMDPQHRIFLECAWEALERAGYDPDTFRGLIGVYAGTSLSSYLLFNLLENPSIRESTDAFPTMVGNDKDFLSTRVSYHLNLRGPSLDIQTGCSTSLVALHLACEALLSCQCDMALAGGVSITVPQRTGYHYHPGGVTSPDGRCRPFEARAQGTVFGNGVGVVLLKRLDDAIADGDTIYAIVKGSAINNDGSSKVGYTAPSVEGQAEAIARAHAIAGIGASSISYVEAHGTGTQLGDPAEIQALTKAFRASSELRQFCAVGSVKGNIGHLDAAAGIAGVIKTTLALVHKKIPPSASFEQANDQIDFSSTPFYINENLIDWNVGQTKRRAGVSSFGIGGTNAHVVLEEAPIVTDSPPDPAPQLLILSAKTERALDTMIGNLARHLRRTDQNVADVAYTLQVGRKNFRRRSVLICKNNEDALDAFENSPERILRSSSQMENMSIAFLFPGQGAQKVGMAVGLYESERVFREHVDRCCGFLTGTIPIDLREVLYPSPDKRAEAAQLLSQTAFAQPALFITEYALAQLWMSWGVQPEVMIGHSLGEYVAASIASVFTLEDALALVSKRAQLMQSMPPGAMLAVALTEDRARQLCDATLSLAAVNGPGQCVISGPLDRIGEVETLLSRSGVSVQRLVTSHAFHSSMMDPIIDQFAEWVARFQIQAPSIPIASNLTGSWLAVADVTDPRYWARQLRETVRFSDGLTNVLSEAGWVPLEVGPGQTLSNLARNHPARHPERYVIASLESPIGQQSDSEKMRTNLGRLWLAGVPIDWSRLHDRGRRQRVPLPTYPLERQRYWIDPDRTSGPFPQEQTEARADPADWFYIPGWKRILPFAAAQTNNKFRSSRWLVFDDGSQFASEIISRLRRAGQGTVSVTAGVHCGPKHNGGYEIDPSAPDHYVRLLDWFAAAGTLPDRVLHMWNCKSDRGFACREESFTESQTTGFFSLLYFVQAVASKRDIDMCISVVTRCVHDVTGQERVFFEDTTIPALCDVVPQELPNVRCQSIDIDFIGASKELLADQVVSEIMADEMTLRLAIRNGHRWVPIYEPLHLTGAPDDKTPLRPGGVYMIIGGLGAIGLTLCEFLASTARTRIVLVQRSPFPPEGQWSSWIERHGEQDSVSQTIRRLQSVQATGAQVLIESADVANRQEIEAVIRRARMAFGALHGIIHAAGPSGKTAVRFLRELDRVECERHFAPRVHGLYVLDDVLRDNNLDFRLIFSSNASILGGPGLLAYAAAHRFVDTFAGSQNRPSGARWICVNWDPWSVTRSERPEVPFSAAMNKYLLMPGEGTESLRRILSRTVSGQFVVSAASLNSRLQKWLLREQSVSGSDDPVTFHARPAIDTLYVAPTSDVEKRVTEIWQKLLGLDQIGIHDNFFELGGTSLIAAKIIERINTSLSVELPIINLFEYPTVTRLVKSIAVGEERNVECERRKSRGERRRELNQQRGG